MADEWTSIRNRRYLNVIISSTSYTANLGLVRCTGSVTAKEVVKVSFSTFLNLDSYQTLHVLSVPENFLQTYRVPAPVLSTGIGNLEK
jgi:hypothetical protein